MVLHVQIKMNALTQVFAVPMLHVLTLTVVLPVHAMLVSKVME